MIYLNKLSLFNMASTLRRGLALMLLLFIFTIQPASASIIIFEKPELSVPQGEERTVAFSILGEEKKLTIGELEGLPDGLDISITKDQVSLDFSACPRSQTHLPERL